MALSIKLIGDTRDLIGESPWWDGSTNRLTWVDSQRGLIRSLVWDAGVVGEVTTRDLGGTIGSLAGRRGGGHVIAGSDGFRLIDPDGTLLDPLGDPESGEPRTRFNDGKTDRQGAFLAGTMVHRSDDPAVGGLYRLTPDRRMEKLESDWRSSNGPCFSPDGKTFYFADSVAQTIWAYDYRTDAPLSNKRLFLDTRTLNAIPDGATVDADGCLWSCLVTVGKIVRVSPAGKVDRIIDMPVPMPASVMFGGDRLETLFVTSLGLTFGGFVPEHPMSGGLFAIEGLGVRGLPETPYSG